MILDSEQSEIGGMGPKYHEMGCEGTALTGGSFKGLVLTLEIDDDKEHGFI